MTNNKVEIGPMTGTPDILAQMTLFLVRRESFQLSRYVFTWYRSRWIVRDTLTPDGRREEDSPREVGQTYRLKADGPPSPDHELRLARLIHSDWCRNAWG